MGKDVAILCSCSPRLRRSPASGAARHICMPLRSMCTQAQCCVSHCHTIPTRVLPFPDPQDNHGLEIPEVLDEGYISLAPHHPPFDTHLSCPSHVAPESTVQKPNGRFGPDRLWTVMRITVATISRANRSSQQLRPRGDKRRSWADSSSSWCLWKVVIQLSEDHAGNTIKLT